jgi:hypothetical protein
VAPSRDSKIWTRCRTISGEEAPDPAESAAPAARTTPETIRRPTGIAVCQNHRRDPRTLLVVISMML